MRLRIWFIALSGLLVAACSGGYSFTGGDVGEAKTLSVASFDNQADLVNPQLAGLLTEGIQDVMVRQSPLKLVPRDGDMQLSGSVVQYEVRAEAPKAGDALAQSRLNMVVRVQMVNVVEEGKDFSQTFNSFRNFPTTQSLAEVEDALIEEMVDELAQKIFNRALVQW